MADQNLTPQPWNNDYNVRGASITLTNKENESFVYYLCFIDFPSNFDFFPGNGVSFSFNEPIVTMIPNTGQYNYDTTKQYSQATYTVVYYQNQFYNCIADTANPAGPFDPKCWQAVGANVYQLNYTYQDYGNGWPNATPGATIVTYCLPIFTTDAGYDPSSGPIILTSVTNQTSAVAKTGDPNHRRPPIVNLPLTERNAGAAGTPVLLAFSSLTYLNGQNYWLAICVNTGNAGYSNKFSIQASAPNYIAAFDQGTSDHGIVAIGTVEANDTNPIGEIDLTENPSTVVKILIPAPMSTIPRYYTI